MYVKLAVGGLVLGRVSPAVLVPYFGYMCFQIGWAYVSSKFKLLCVCSLRSPSCCTTIAHVRGIEAIVPVSNVGSVVTCSKLMLLDVLLSVRVHQFGMTMLTTSCEVKAFE